MMLILLLYIKLALKLSLCLLAEYDTYDDVEVVPVPVPVAWLEWGPWSSAACSAPGGQMVRVRSCAGALPCVDGFPQEQKPCGTVEGTVTLCTLQRNNTENLKQIFPEKKLRCQSPNFHIHVS
jgi:hypothetical protein